MYGAVSIKVENAHSLKTKIQYILYIYTHKYKNPSLYTIRMYKNMLLVVFKREEPKSPSTGVRMRNLW